MNRQFSSSQSFKPAGTAAKSEQSVSHAIQMSAALSAEGGVDLTQVPVRPALHTEPRIQCCAADGSGCSCPKCQEAASEKVFEGVSEAETLQQSEPAPEQSAVDETAPEQSAVSDAIPGESTAGEATTEPESSSSPGSPEATADTSSVTDKTSSSLIVEDSAAEVQTGQMKKTQFLQLLREGICNGIDPILAKAGRSSEGCPYLNYWMDMYQHKDAAHIERAAKKYAPDTANAKSAEDYISIIVERAMSAAEIWVATGKLTGVPEGVPTTIPGQPAPQEAGRARRVQAKAKTGGIRNDDDTQVIQQELGPGETLPGNVRARMESAFGTSFSHVRTHTDTTANSLSKKMNARAFAIGNHVAFGQGEYQPGTIIGDALIAHELAHTIQQSGSNAGEVMRADDGGNNVLEQDADQAAAGVLGRLWGKGKNELKGMARRSLPALRSGLRLQRCGGDKKPAAATNTKTMPAGSISGSVTGMSLNATGTYSDCSACTDGMEAMQVAWGTGGPHFGTHDTTVPPLTDTFSSCVDGGKNSPGGAVYSGDHPYYIGRSDLPASYGYNGGQGSAGSVTGCTVNVTDAPTAQMFTELYFETAFVCLNYQGSGKDKLLETFKWGFYSSGTKHRPTPSSADSNAVEQHSGPSAKFEETLKADYPSYTHT